MTGIRSNLLVALGANLPSSAGAPEKTLISALSAMVAGGLALRAVSRFYATPCFPAGAGPDYVNAVVRVASRLDPPEVLSLLHRIEAEFGRARTTRWGMRTLDLDLIADGDRVLPDAAGLQRWMALPAAEQTRATPDRLILPHPRLQDRAFVLVPLADVAPDWRHPLLHRTAAQLRAALPTDEIDAIRPI